MSTATGMSLDQFLSSEGAPTAADFAAEVGVSAVSISRIRKGEQNITRDLMRSIIRASGGRISAESLIGLADNDSAPEVAPGPFPGARKATGSPSSPICSEMSEAPAMPAETPAASSRPYSDGPLPMPREAGDPAQDEAA